MKTMDLALSAYHVYAMSQIATRIANTDPENPGRFAPPGYAARQGLAGISYGSLIPIRWSLV